MNFKMLSLVTGTNACICKCPFCVSCEVMNKENMIQPEINFRNLNIACNLANRSNVDTVMITSRGEPLLFPEQISQYLNAIKKYNFPFVELQTNGILLESDKLNNYLIEWYNNGLTTITISTISYKEKENGNFYLNKDNYINLEKLVQKLHKYGFTVRLTCICFKNQIDNGEEVLKYIRYANSIDADQVTIRPLNLEYRREDAKNFTHNNILTEEQIKDIFDMLNNNGTLLLNLERIGYIYDVEGQNVCITKSLTKYTRNTDPNNIRNLIFFPEGKIMYEWEMDGAILLR